MSIQHKKSYRLDDGSYPGTTCDGVWLSHEQPNQSVAVVLIDYCFPDVFEESYLVRDVIFDRNNDKGYTVCITNDQYGSLLVEGLEYDLQAGKINYQKEVGVLTQKQFDEIRTLQANLSNCEPPIKLSWNLGCNKDGVGESNVILMRVDIDEQSLVRLFSSRQA